MNMVARLLLIVVADAFAADGNADEARQLTSQWPLLDPPQMLAQSAAGPSTMSPNATAPDPTVKGKADGHGETERTATSHANAEGPGVASKVKKKILVDNTVNDEQLKQILAKGYKPGSQASGNEVYYCRSEPELGSRFEKKICKTAARILQDEVEGKSEASLLERPSGNRPQN
jgi:hypothetical protein